MSSGLPIHVVARVVAECLGYCVFTEDGVDLCTEQAFYETVGDGGWHGGRDSQIAHIRGERDGSLRHEDYPPGLNHPSNLALMCLKHHRRIDSASHGRHYDVDRLTKMRETIRQRVINHWNKKSQESTTHSLWEQEVHRAAKALYFDDWLTWRLPLDGTSFSKIGWDQSRRWSTRSWADRVIDGAGLPSRNTGLDHAPFKPLEDALVTCASAAQKLDRIYVDLDFARNAWNDDAEPDQLDRAKQFASDLQTANEQFLTSANGVVNAWRLHDNTFMSDQASLSDFADDWA